MGISPESWRDGDCRYVAVPALALALRFAEDVTHDLPPGALRRDAVLGPLGQVLQVEGQVVLRNNEYLCSGVIPGGMDAATELCGA